MGHDAAREGDRGEQWEEQSAAYIKHFLTQGGLDSQLAEIFSHLAYLNDNSQKLKHYLDKLGLSQEIIDGLQYARLLISLADCFDSIRCKNSFDFACIEEKLAEVFPYA